MPRKHQTYGAIEDYQDNELVVALPDCGVVTRALTSLNIRIRPEDNKLLGLALLTLGNVADAIRGVPGYADLVQRVTGAKWPSDLPQRTGGPSDLDVLLYKLREDISVEYSGWTPEMGKNRTISPVVGFPHVSGCTEGDPSLLGFADPQLPEPGPSEPAGTSAGSPPGLRHHRTAGRERGPAGR